MIPRMSFRMGTTGLVSANLSSILNTSNYSCRAWYFALNSVSLLSTFLDPLHLSKNPVYELLALSLSMFFSYSPSLISELIALTKLFFIWRISSLFLAWGRILNSLTRSRGKANRPTPPNSTRNIHPKYDMMAITYTAKEASKTNSCSISV